MERLHKDELILIAMNLEYSDIISMCETHPKFNESICRNDTFWFNKLRRDYPNYQSFNIQSGYKDIYKTIYDIHDIKWRLRLGGSLLDLYNRKRLSLIGNAPYQGIENLPESIGSLTNLQYLNVNGNLLQELPESIGNLSNLQELRSSRNNLKTLPNSIGNLTNLTSLDLDRNDLKFLPDSIGNLTNLQTLSLVHNLLEELPESIGHLPNLTLIRIRGNELSDIPESIKNNTKIRVLKNRNY